MSDTIEEIQNAIGDRGVVAMSGGVDSSVTAALMKKQASDVVAISMRLYKEAPRSDRSCCSPDDLFDARSVAASLDIPFYVANYVDEFRQRVIDYFVDEYRRGRTPNPCVACNNFLKFDILLKRTRALGGAWLATGHYAQVVEEDGRFKLKRGVDPNKDQSYFLWGLPREELPRIKFPLGGLTKPEVRDIAASYGLPTAAKAESQEICFVVGESYSDFVKRQLADDDVINGNFELPDGTVLGPHGGIHKYTVGQRRGLGIAYKEPLYVLQIQPETGTVVVGAKKGLFADGFVSGPMNWLAWEEPPAEFEALVQIRYRSKPVPARIQTLEGGTLRVHFERPQAAVTPGQSAVLYHEDEVLGGGMIEAAF